MGRLFGTDGVRGVANADLTPELAFRLGRAAAAVLAHHAGGEGRPWVLIGRDTRLSGDMLEAALAAGLMSAGVDVHPVGILPTPAVAYLTRHLGATAGAVISASHNPVPDNGIKFFGASGFKLPDPVEDEIQALVEAKEDRLPRPVGEGVGRAMAQHVQALEAYVARLARACTRPYLGRVVIDAAHGAAATVVGPLVQALGLTAEVIHGEPDGRRINVGCGSTHPEDLCRAVLERGADVGLAFDGDADRLIAVDERGGLVDGDRLMAILALWLLRRGRLKERTVVVTVMSNLGLRACLEAHGGKVLETRVGDRYVLEAMRERGLSLGGEQSGHIIFLDEATTGDGLLTAVKLLSVLAEEGRPLSELAACMRPYPQVLVNVRVARKEGWEEDAPVQAAVAEAERALAGRGRVVVRASGTEPLIRVMVEAPDAAEVEAWARHIARAIAAARGGEIV